MATCKKCGAKQGYYSPLSFDGLCQKFASAEAALQLASNPIKDPLADQPQVSADHTSESLDPSHNSCPRCKSIIVTDTRASPSILLQGIAGFIFCALAPLIGFLGLIFAVIASLIIAAIPGQIRKTCTTCGHIWDPTVSAIQTPTTAIPHNSPSSFDAPGNASTEVDTLHMINAMPGDIVECPNCRIRISVTRANKCPSCRTVLGHSITE